MKRLIIPHYIQFNHIRAPTIVKSVYNGMEHI